MKLTTDRGLDFPARQKFSRLFLIFSVLLLGALPALAQTNVTGFWVLNIPTDDGNTMKTFFDLTQAGEKVTGSAWIRNRKSTLSEGSLSGGKLHLTEQALSDRIQAGFKSIMTVRSRAMDCG